MRTEETKARRQRVQLEYKLDAANLALERAIKGKDRMVGNLKAALQDMTRRYEEEHRRRIHAEQEANRQRHLYQGTHWFCGNDCLSRWNHAQKVRKEKKHRGWRR